MLKLERLTGAIGAIVSGIDLRAPLPNAVFAELREALYAHQLLLFRDQPLDDAQHRALALRFGPLDGDGMMRLMKRPPDLRHMEDKPDRAPGPGVAERWHTDVSWVADPPSLGLLHCQIAPAYGGDTLWASLFAAYEALSPAMRAFCEGLSVVNYPSRGFLRSALAVVGSEARVREAFPSVEHPLIRSHPVTGQPLLYLTGTMQQIVGLTAEESDTLITYLRGLLNNPSLQARWKWRAGDLAVWDQASTNHCALSDHYPQHRVMRHCAVAGGAPYYRQVA